MFRFPRTNMHELNLDWILNKIKELDKKINSILPVNIPKPSNSNPLPLGTASPGISDEFSRGDHVHEKPTYTKSDVGLGNVDNVKQYSDSNPPPYPVISVAGKTGAVTLDGNDVTFDPDDTYDSNTVGNTLNSIQSRVYDTVEVINVLKYGVLNNNNGNQATKINELISDCADGTTIYLPPGTYRITDPIVINKRIHFICDGTIRGVLSNVNHCVKITAGYTDVSIYEILCATGNSNGLLISPDGVANMEYVNLHFSRIEASSSSTLDAILIKTTGSYFCNYVNISGDYIDGKNNTINCIGIVKTGSGNIGEIRIHDVRLNRGLNGIYMENQLPNNNNLTGVSCTNVTLETCINGIFMKNVLTPSFNNLRCGEQQANNLLTIEGALIQGYLQSKNSIKLTTIDITNIDATISSRSAFYLNGVVYDSDIDTTPKNGALIYGGSIHKLLANEAP